MLQPYSLDALRSLWHISNTSDHVTVNGQEYAARFFYKDDSVKLFDYDTHKCVKSMSPADFVKASGAPLDVPAYAPYLHGWITAGHSDHACQMSEDPSKISSSTVILDHQSESLFSMPVALPLRERRSPADSW